ncbi:MAG TPA: nitrite reductase small subunit NirD [Parvibaculum sp.]|jgi:nitrite reductase (NADH) small subunit
MGDFTWKKIGLIAEIPLRGARRLCFGHEGSPIAVFRTGADTFFALIDECPHRAGPLSEGIVAGETVTCPLHNWVIDLRSGEAASPDEGRARSLPVRIEAGELYVGLPIRETA